MNVLASRSPPVPPPRRAAVGSLARWAVALPALSPSLAKQPGYRPSQTVDNMRKTRHFPTKHRLPKLAAVRPDFETFAETRVSRLHWGRSMSYALQIGRPSCR